MPRLLEFRTRGRASSDFALSLGIAMFTSEPSLAQQIERMIGDTPVIDPHTHLRADRPNAPDLAALIGHRAVVAQLRSVGIELGDLDPSLPAEERVRRAIPYLGQIRNTSASWCLFRIFRDLYDFGDPILTEANYRDLFDKVAATATDLDWTQTVLRGKSNLRAVVTDQGIEGDAQSTDPALFHHSCDLRQPLTSLLEPSRSRPSSAASFHEAIGRWLDQALVGQVRFAVLPISIAQGFERPEVSQVDAALARRDDPRLSDDSQVLSNQLAWSVLAWHHENRRPLRIVFDNRSASGAGWASSMARSLLSFSGAKVEVLVGTETVGHEVAELAGLAPNVYAPGDGWRTLSSLAIERSFGHRVQLAPMTKIGGFASGGENVEWVYGTLQVVRKAMATTLATMVDSRFFEEDEVPPLLYQILHDTPLDLFGLGIG